MFSFKRSASTLLSSATQILKKPLVFYTCSYPFKYLGLRFVCLDLRGSMGENAKTEKTRKPRKRRKPQISERPENEKTRKRTMPQRKNENAKTRKPRKPRKRENGENAKTAKTTKTTKMRSDQAWWWNNFTPNPIAQHCFLCWMFFFCAALLVHKWREIILVYWLFLLLLCYFLNPCFQSTPLNPFLLSYCQLLPIVFGPIQFSSIFWFSFSQCTPSSAFQVGVYCWRQTSHWQDADLSVKKTSYLSKSRGGTPSKKDLCIEIYMSLFKEELYTNYRSCFWIKFPCPKHVLPSISNAFFLQWPCLSKLRL